MKFNNLFSGLALAAILVAPAAFAADPKTNEEITEFNKQFPMPTGKMLSNNCSACHGTLGGEFTEGMPSLAGMDKQEFIEIFTQFRDNKYPTIVMHDVAYVFTDEEIEAMADYFAAQRAEQWPHLNDDGTIKQGRMQGASK